MFGTSEAAATPGGHAPLGVEFNAELFIREHGRFLWNLQYGVLFPMEGLEYITGGGDVIEPTTAQTLQMNIGMQF